MICCCSVAQSCLTFSNPMDYSTPNLPSPSLSPRVYSKLCPLSPWCNPTIPCSVVPCSSCLQCFPASGSNFPMSQLFSMRVQITLWYPVSFLLDIYPEVRLLNGIVVTFLIFWGTSVLFSIMAAPRILFIFSLSFYKVLFGYLKKFIKTLENPLKKHIDRLRAGLESCLHCWLALKADLKYSLSSSIKWL